MSSASSGAASSIACESSKASWLYSLPSWREYVSTTQPEPPLSAFARSTNSRCQAATLPKFCAKAARHGSGQLCAGPRTREEHGAIFAQAAEVQLVQGHG